MSGLILPGPQPKPGLQIYVPDRYADEPLVGLCRVPVDADGEICGARFYRGQEQEWQRHVGRCARQHEDAVQAVAAQRRDSIFGTHPDPEYEAHMLRVGKRMLREGRWTVKKNEV